MELDLLRVFVEVADRGGFTAAAEALGLPRSSVSRRVARLESDLGVQLLHRTTRKIRLSSAGEALYGRVAPSLATIDRALSDLPEREDEPSGRLRVTAPLDVAVTVLASAFAGFARRYPAVDVELQTTAERLDLVAEGFDVAIRTAPEPLPDSSLRGRRLGTATAEWYAAPSYLQRQGRPRHPGDPEHCWIEGPGWALPETPSVIVVDEMLMVRAMVQEGLGVGILPDFVARAGLLEGVLQRVALDEAPRSFGLFALYPPVRPMPRKLRAFVDYLAEQLKGRPL